MTLCRLQIGDTAHRVRTERKGEYSFALAWAHPDLTTVMLLQGSILERGVHAASTKLRSIRWKNSRIGLVGDEAA